MSTPAPISSGTNTPTRDGVAHPGEVVLAVAGAGQAVGEALLPLGVLGRRGAEASWPGGRG